VQRPEGTLLAAADGFPASVLSEDVLRDYVDLLVRLVEAAGAAVIFIGAVLAAVGFVRAAVGRHRDREFVRVRLGLGRYLTLGLEFQLASDVLSTAIAPTFGEIGKLAAVAAIRTVLNYFLAKEIQRERAEVEGEGVKDGEPVAAGLTVTAVLQTAALACTVLGLLSAAATLLRAHDVRLSLRVLLDFLLAAGLLRLSADTTIRSLATAAVIVVVRKVARFGLTRRSTPDPRRSARPTAVD
jgi:uncharacterized membrane protein